MKLDGDRFGWGTKILSNEQNGRKEFMWKNKTKKNLRSLVEEGKWKWTIKEDDWSLFDYQSKKTFTTKTFITIKWPKLFQIKW